MTEKPPTEDRRPINAQMLAAALDHTCLRPDSTDEDVDRLCREAVEYRFATVCIASRWVAVASRILDKLGSSEVRVCAVVGFPHGNSRTAVKSFEASLAIADGATEIDMVVSIGDFKDRNERAFIEDIQSVAHVVHSHGGVLKTILETGYLDPNEIALASRLAVDAGADFIKTSTGYGPSGADAHTIRLIRDAVQARAKIKASGGIKTLDFARELMRSGADRLGASSSVNILRELTGGGK